MKNESIRAITHFVDRPKSQSLHCTVMYQKKPRNMQPRKALTFLLVTLSLSFCYGRPRPSLNTGAARPRSLSSLPPTTISPSGSDASSSSMSTAALLEIATSTNGGGTKFTSYDKVDWVALVKYPIGLAVQMSLMFGFFTGIDSIVAHYSVKVPFAVNFLFLYAFNLKSSLFSIFPSKSEASKVNQESWEYNKRKRPSWTPPGIAFVIGWPLLTFGLRAFTGAMVVESIGSYANPAIMSLMLHLCIGTLWNTVSNVERRLGVSVVLIYGLWLTKAFAAIQFYKVEPLAGKLLALSLTWITAACALSTRTWQINPDPTTGKLEPLVPMQHPKWSTKFLWEQ